MHVHASSANSKMQNVLRFSLVLTLAYVGVTFFAGLRAHSLALISEAGHNISDALALLLSFVAVYFQSRPATDAKTFGYQRAGVLAAFVNATTLLVLSAWIAIEAMHRLAAPEPLQPKLMMYVAAAGVLMNGGIALLLSRVNTDVNIRSALIHMLGDTLSTAAVIAGGAAILFTGRTWIDPGALDDYRRADPVEFACDRAGDAEYSARRHAQGHFAAGDSQHAVPDLGG